MVSLANNHLMDFGPAGLADTLATLDGLKIAHFGAGPRPGARRACPPWSVKNGVRFAFLGYFFLGDRNIEPRRGDRRTETTPGVAGHHDDLKTMRAMGAGRREGRAREGRPTW